MTSTAVPRRPWGYSSESAARKAISKSRHRDPIVVVSRRPNAMGWHEYRVVPSEQIPKGYVEVTWRSGKTTPPGWPEPA